MERASARISTSNNKSKVGFEQHRQTASTVNRKFAAVGIVIALAAVTIVAVAMQGSAVYYVSVADFNLKMAGSATADKEIRVAGKVLPGTIARDETSRQLTFLAVDKDNPAQTVKVAYNKIIPDTFKDNAEVVVTGTYQNGVFLASEMLAKCPSKYSSSAADANK